MRFSVLGVASAAVLVLAGCTSTAAAAPVVNEPAPVPLVGPSGLEREQEVQSAQRTAFRALEVAQAERIRIETEHVAAEKAAAEAERVAAAEAKAARVATKKAADEAAAKSSPCSNQPEWRTGIRQCRDQAEIDAQTREYIRTHPGMCAVGTTGAVGDCSAEELEPIVKDQGFPGEDEVTCYAPDGTVITIESEWCTDGYYSP